MKARYYRDITVLEAQPRKNQSYGWSSILVGISLIKKGSRFNIGDGKTIRLGIDNVLDSHPPRPITAINNGNNDTINTLMSVSGQARSWDMVKLEAIIRPEDIDEIKNMFLSQADQQDSIIWNYSPSGDYTVKSGYWLLTHDPLSCDIPPDIPHGSPDLKRKIWRLPVIPKLKHFLWRIISRSLPTLSRLRSRGMNLDTLCSRCHQAEETINHALFTCPFALMVWRFSSTSHINIGNLANEAEENILTLVTSVLNTVILNDESMLPFCLLWRIWKARNNVIFNNIRESPSKTVLWSKSDAKQFYDLTNHTKQQNQRGDERNLDKWRPPTAGYVKCNFDAGYNNHNHEATGGWVIRNNSGSALAWGASRLPHTSSPLEAEAKAMLVALQQTWIRGYTSIILEGDCEVLINIINDGKKHRQIINILLDLKLWISKFHLFTSVFTKRSCNKSAHLLAQFGCNVFPFYAESVIKPLCLHEQLCIDQS